MSHTSFTPNAGDLHLGQLRFGVTPAINATAAMILGVTLVTIAVAYVVLRRTAQGREGTAMPDV